MQAAQKIVVEFMAWNPETDERSKITANPEIAYRDQVAMSRARMTPMFPLESEVAMLHRVQGDTNWTHGITGTTILEHPDRRLEIVRQMFDEL